MQKRNNETKSRDMAKRNGIEETGQPCGTVAPGQVSPETSASDSDGGDVREVIRESLTLQGQAVLDLLKTHGLSPLVRGFELRVGGLLGGGWSVVVHRGENGGWKGTTTVFYGDSIALGDEERKALPQSINPQTGDNATLGRLDAIRSEAYQGNDAPTSGGEGGGGASVDGAQKHQDDAPILRPRYEGGDCEDFEWEGVDADGDEVSVCAVRNVVWFWEEDRHARMAYPTHEQAFKAADALAKSIAKIGETK